MPSDEYTSNTRGSLRLKGSSTSGIAKKKKKKKQQAAFSEESKSVALEQVIEDEAQSSAIATGTSNKDKDGAGKEKAEIEDREEKDEEDEAGHEQSLHDGKTSTERAAEEMRRKRLLNQNATPHLLKTHKQRVEDLNKYLSNLSEHHDMPRIGPG